MAQHSHDTDRARVAAAPKPAAARLAGRAARGLAALLLALCCALGATLVPAAAAERILNFVSDVTVQRNGDLLVAETIVVNAEGDKIRRGILRDFPTIYSGNDGRRVEVGFDVQSVMLDGKTESYAT